MDEVGFSNLRNTGIYMSVKPGSEGKEVEIIEQDF